MVMLPQNLREGGPAGRAFAAADDQLAGIKIPAEAFCGPQGRLAEEDQAAERRALLLKPAKPPGIGGKPLRPLPLEKAQAPAIAISR